MHRRKEGTELVRARVQAPEAMLAEGSGAETNIRRHHYLTGAHAQHFENDVKVEAQADNREHHLEIVPFSWGSQTFDGRWEPPRGAPLPGGEYFDSEWPPRKRCLPTAVDSRQRQCLH